MNDPVNLIKGLDQTTVNGLAEALMIAMLNLKNSNGQYLAIRLSDDPAENIELAEDVATMLLKARE